MRFATIRYLVPLLLIVIFLFSIGSLLEPVRAFQPVTVDSFNATQTTIALRTPPPPPSFPIVTTNSVTTSGSDILGGERDAEVILNDSDFDFLGIRFVSGGANNQASFSWDSTTDGTVRLVWDGNDNSPTINHTGLGGGDATAGGTADAFILGVVNKDANPIDLTMTVFTDAGNSCSLTVTLANAIAFPGEDIALPFANFTTCTGAGADFTNVGAVVFEVSSNVDADFVLDFITTGTVATITKDDDVQGNPSTLNLIVDGDSDGRADIGDRYRYTAIVENPPDSFGADVDGVFFRDTITDPNITLVPGSVTVTQPPGFPAGNITVAGQSITVDIGMLLEGETVVIEYDVDVIGSTGAQAANQATLDTSLLTNVPSDDPNDPTSDSDPTITPIDTPPDVTLTKTHQGGASFAPGQVIIYDLVIDNLGGFASGVTIDDVVPVGTVFDAANSTAGWSCADGAPAGTTCTITTPDLDGGGPLVAGDVPATGDPLLPFTVNFAVRVLDPLPAGINQIDNTATANAPGDSNTGNNTDPDPAPPTVNAAPDLVITKDDGGITVNPNGTITYTITYQNVGNQDATGVVITDLDADIVNATSDDAANAGFGWDCTTVPTECSFAVGNLPAGGPPQTVSFTVIAIAAPVPAGADDVTNIVSIADDGTNGPDPTPGNNSDNETTPLNAAPDVFITKDDGGVTVQPGDTISYTLTFGNNGDQDAANIVITETVPNGTTFNAGASSPGWSCTPDNSAGSTCTLNIGTVAGNTPAPGGAGTATFAVDVDNPLVPALSQIDNTADITTPAEDTDTGNNSDTDNTPVETASLGDFVWDDLNANGIQDGGEPGVGGVTVNLLDGASNPTGLSTTTAADGSYSFTGLIPGNYIVEFVLPVGFSFSPQDQGGDDTVDSDADTGSGRTGVITLAAGANDITNDAGIFQLAALGDFVWDDLNANGIQDGGEPGIGGVTVNLLNGAGNPTGQSTTTAADGSYSFTNLAPGDYIVEFVLPAGRTFTLQDQGGDDSIDSDADTGSGRTGIINLSSGETDNTNDAGMIAPAALGDFVWDDLNGNGIQDGGEPGIGGVTVNLLDGGGTQINTTTTAADGSYSFTNLAPGDYIVEFVLPAGRVFSPQNQGGDDTIDSDADTGSGRTGLINLSSGETDNTNDAGMFTPATIGDFVWDDLNNNGVQDGGGEVGIGGVTVNLLDGGGTQINTTTTAADGSYSFTNLAPGNYIVEFVLPAGRGFSPQDQGGDDTVDSDADTGSGRTGVITVTSGQTDNTNDAGMVQLAALGDFVWDDLNNNGIQDGGGEVGIGGVTVNLLNGAGNPTGQSTTTAADGSYSFTNLLPGDYIVEFVLPAGRLFSPANQGVDDTVDSDADTGSGRTGVINLSPGETDNTNDAGMFAAGTIGDFVWDDLNANGIQDGGEPGVGGVTVNLLDGGGTQINTTTTAVDGSYSFTNLLPGDYIVEFVLPAGATFSPANQGGDDNLDSDADTGMGRTGVITLGPGTTDNSNDAGIFTGASLGDFVWDDLDGDGIQDGGEPGIGGVTVNLLDGGGTQINTTTTAADGSYSFTGLTPGDYIVEFVLPAGFEFSPQDQGGDDTIDSDADTGIGRTGVITLTSGQTDNTNDAGMLQRAALGDFVWEDTNGNGVQDGGELGVDGVTVNLLDSGGTQINTTTTSGGGLYSFTNLLPGDYIVEFVAPGGFSFTQQDQGGDDTIDSDANPGDGRTGLITLTSGLTDNTNDAGLTQSAALGDFVWNDLNADGIQDAGEPGIDGVTVNLLDSGGTQIDTTTTSGGGAYSFTNLVPGDYIVEFVLPAGFSFSPQDQGGDDTIDSDANTGNGRTATISLASGETNNTIDAGMFSPTSLAVLGDFVWNDLNQDGIQDAGEPGIDGVTVNLLDSGGTQIDTTTTSGGGLYQFANLLPGDYIVEFVLPAGFSFSPRNRGGDDSVDSDPRTGNGRTGTITLGPGAIDNTVDAGMFNAAGLASLGDFVWQDLDNDGIQDAGEPGLGGVTVNLLDGGGTQIDTTTTAGDGSYLFDNLVAGNYIVEFVLPGGFTFGPQDQGADDTVDSDADTGNGRTTTITLTDGENNDTVDAGLVPPAGLNVTKTASANSVFLGDTVTYTVTITNTSGGALDNTTFTDDLVTDPPATTGFDPASISWTCVANGGAICANANGTGEPINETILAFPNNSSVIFTINATVPTTTTPGNIDNTATATPPSGPPVQDTVTVGVIFDPPTGQKVGVVLNNTTIEWTMVWQNTGGVAQPGITITDIIPPGQTFVGGSLTCPDNGATVGTCNEAGGTITWNGTMGPAGDDLTITYQVNVPGPGTYNNVGTLSGPNVQTVTAANTVTIGSGGNQQPGGSSDEEGSQPGPTLFDPAIVKLGDPAFAQPGERVTWTITVSNPHDVALDNVSVTDTAPPELEVLSANAQQGSATVNGQVIQANLGTLSPGQSVTITVVTRIRDDVGVPFIIENPAELNAPYSGLSTARVLSVSELPATGQSPLSALRLPVFIGVLTLLGLLGITMTRVYRRRRHDAQ